MYDFERGLFGLFKAFCVLVLAALSLGGCGVSSPTTPLPEIDHTRPATLLNEKQKKTVLKDMAKVAEKQNQQAAKITPITYRIPENSP